MAILKNNQDLENLKYSCRILMSCYEHLEDMLRPGISASELDDFAIKFIRSYDAEPSFLGYQGFGYALCTSVNNEVVHGLSNKDKIIPDNSLVSLDLGVVYKGMFSDSAKTFVLGDVPTAAIKLVEKTEMALMEGIKTVKAGKKIGDIGFAINQVAQKNGLGNVLDLGGHGVGYAVHESPFIMNSGRQGVGATLFENQVIAIEPMFTLGSNGVDFDESTSDGWTVRTSDGSLSAHFEHTVLVTKKGHEILTIIEKDQVLPSSVA
jgi:methionyl aminopeptidase